MEKLPLYISIFFGLTTVLTLLLFFWTIKKSNSQLVKQNAVKILIGLILWLVIQAVLTLQNVYSDHIDLFPPTILIFGILPALLAIIVLFLAKRGRQFIDSLPLVNVTYLNIIRIPVELALFWLFLNETLPELMTFEGSNFDIFAGISAPLIAYALTRGSISRKVVLIWNFICLALLINIVAIAFLSAPSPVQQFAFEQPNIAILHFPFSWLPTFIVPVVLFGHLTSIRQLLKYRD